MIKYPFKPHIFFTLGFILIAASCVSSGSIPDDLSPAELEQRAQEASDRNRYDLALEYYEAMLDRNSNNIDIVITAKYEIAFIHYKQKKYQQAHEELNEVLEYYKDPDEELLPQQFKRLAQIVLNSISEK
ncbi:MAG: tetratricopeptide repeat protein [Treponema sp.]|jgi:outer membrane protein assembly factor BamD (BamD/ComL family)|nr:tetratricopeptide repeat protein [Treponema sp.]